MHVKKKMRTKIILFVIAALLFLYWRGIKNVSDQKGWNCTYHVVYAICDAKNNKAQLPGIWEIIKAGTKF
jgi:hypothetical protein